MFMIRGKKRCRKSTKRSKLRKQKTRLKISWILTLKSCLVMGAGSVYAARRGSGARSTSLIWTCILMQSLLTSLCAMMALRHRSKLWKLSIMGWWRKLTILWLLMFGARRKNSKWITNLSMKMFKLWLKHHAQIWEKDFSSKLKIWSLEKPPNLFC